MSTYFRAPGAWLGAAFYPDPWRTGFYPDPPLRAGLYPDPWQFAALYPDPPRRSGSYPPVDGAGYYPPVDGAGHYPPVDGAGYYPPVDGAGHYPDPPRRGPRNSGTPWLGVDPAWAYAGGEPALRALALRKVRTRIVRPSDPRLLRPTVSGAVSSEPAINTLWRWEAPWRVKAVAGELLGRFAVKAGAGEASVLQLPSPGTRRGALPVIHLKWPGARFDFGVQIDRVVRAAVEREDRLPEILTQRADIGAFFDAISGINREASPRFTELLLALSEATEYLLMGLKHHAGVYRPAQRSGLIQPVIPAPGHGSVPSGHATMAALNSRLLTLLAFHNDEASAVHLDLLARRIAFNRVVAGVHFPLDSAAGYQLGHALVDAFIGLAVGAPAGGPPAEFLPEEDSELAERVDGGIARPAVPSALAQALEAAAAARHAARLDLALRQAPKKGGGKKALAPGGGSDTPLLAELFRAAQEEICNQLR